jgi:hypothetical protein
VKTRILQLRAAVTTVCVKEREHLLLGGAYAASAVWHHSAILTIAYGVTAFGGVHLLRWRNREKRRDAQRAVYHARHLAN